jgi:hypothetical protein
MNYESRWRAIAVLFSLCALGMAQEKDTAAKAEKAAMEIGGYVTVDYSSPIGDSAKPSIQIGEVDLGANVNISEEVVASVVLKTWSRLDSIWIDQALVSYKPKETPLELLFGQQTFNHGLLTTRIISNPYLYDSLPVEYKVPGVILNGTWGVCTGGIGLFVQLGDTSGLRGRTDEIASVVNADFALPNKSMARISSKVGKSFSDIDFAANVNVWKLVFDLEGVTTLKSPSSKKPSGFYAGALLNATDRIGFALRADGVSWDNLKDMGMRYAGGIVVSIKDGIFCCAELGHRAPSTGPGSNEILVEVGIERKLELPGFQRKTLTKD